MDRSSVVGVRRWAALGVIAAYAVFSVVGMVTIYADPERLRIESFSRLYLGLGLSDGVMITLILVLPLTVALAAAATILWRRGEDGAAVQLGVGLAALYFFVSGAALGIDAEPLRDLVSSASVVGIGWLLVGFPTGTVVPFWGRAAPVIAVVIVIVDPGLATRTRAVLSNGALGGAGPGAIAWLGILGVAVAAQVVRYRVHSTREQRYQTRWVLLGLAMMLVAPLVLLILGSIGADDGLAAGLLVGVSSAGSFILPGAVAVAVFRYHLYELDRIVSRTVTYALVAVVVALVYALPVVALPAVVGRGSPAVVAGATLAASAVFAPARRRIQTVVDRRFNRARYDAEQEVMALASHLRDRIEGGAVRTMVGQVVGRTLQPASLAVWIRGVEGAAAER